MCRSVRRHQVAAFATVIALSACSPAGDDDVGSAESASDSFIPAAAGSDSGSLRECALSLLSRYHESLGAEGTSSRAALFKENAIWFNAFGAQRTGLENVRAMLEQLASSGTFREARTDLLGTTAQELSGGSIIADQVIRISGQRVPGSGAELPDRFVHLTFVVEKHGEGCLIAYFRAGDLRALPQWTPPADVPASTLTRYVGRYVSTLIGDTVEVRLENDGLRLVLRDGRYLEMEPISTNEFRVQDNLDTFEFLRNGDDRVTHLLIRGAAEDTLTRIGTESR